MSGREFVAVGKERGGQTAYTTADLVSLNRKPALYVGVTRRCQEAQESVYRTTDRVGERTRGDA